jgi:two-component system chemotaxis sensor kinase CheA
MSQEFMDPEIFADFIVEAKEHLETIEPTLLELEKTPGNLNLLNDIFRPMHSLKGASGFLGLAKINSLAHKAESVLEELRKGNMQVTSEVMDVILAATDALRSMIDSLETSGGEGETETGLIISRLEALLAGEAPSEPAAPRKSVPEPQAAPAAQAGAAPPERAPDRPTYSPQLYKLTVLGEGHLVDFLEEAREIIGNLNKSLLDLEANPSGNQELVNDIFRYFHNLKGNSGIIGFAELNALTHEAETLLNRVRRGELAASQPMIDVLLAAVDLIDECVGAIDGASAEVAPPDTAPMIERLQRTANGETVEMPSAPAAASGDELQSWESQSEPGPAAAPDPAALVASGLDVEDVTIFAETVGQQFDNIALALATLKKEPDSKDYIDGLYRSLNTLENSSGYMGFEEQKVYASRTAGLVDQGRKSGIGFELMLDILDQECSILKDLFGKKLAELGLGRQSGAPPAPAKAQVAPVAPVEPVAPSEPQPAAAPAPVRKSEPAPAAKAAPRPAAKPEPQAAAEPAVESRQATAQKSKAASTIRVDHEKLDHLMNLIGELIINRNRFSMLARSLEEGRLEVQQVAQNLVETTYSMARISDDLQDTIMNVRMVPVGSVFSRFPRLVRDLSRKNGKQVELILEGEETELDKSVVEVIGDPLVHMIRNSMDHGLETEPQRLEAGKDPVGKVWLRAYHKGNSVAIEIEDDGRGIDPARMRQVAVKKGVLTQEQAAALDDRQAMELIFAPGFSSAEQVTDISGRGVGMDVVRSNIKNLKGSVAVSSEVGKGTKITLMLPLTLAIIDALLVIVAGERFAIPLDAVSETTKIEAGSLSDVNKRKALELRGEVLGVVQLAELLQLSTEADARPVLPIVVIHDNERRLGLVVDRLLERQEIVIKPLGSYLADFDIRGVSGATIMGDGSVVLILDPHEVYLMATSQGRPGLTA